MAKKSGLIKATGSIAGTPGKGAYTAREVMTGSKCMSRKEAPLTTGSKSSGAKASVMEPTKRIAGGKGKGPLMAREVMGSRRMDCSHGVTSKNTNTNMNFNTGGYRIGAGTRTFRHGLLPQQGGGHGAGHAGQPGGHKKGFNT